MEDMTAKSIQRLLNSINAALSNHITETSGLFDPHSEKPSPADHYGHVFAALALACAGPEAWRIGREALIAWLRLPQADLGHLPFNRLGLILLRDTLSGLSSASGDQALIEKGLERCHLKRNYPSNNWSLLSQACRVLESPISLRDREIRIYCRLLGRWMTQKGGFIDFPPKPRDQISTPFAYHHKALFLTALLYVREKSPGLEKCCQLLLDWLAHCWDRTGYAGGFGRSTHSLFGDACLLAAIIMLKIDPPDSAPAMVLADRLVTQRRGDGFLWLNPAGPVSGADSWDPYMHLSVYNAWAAAIVGFAHQRGAISIKDSSTLTWRANTPGLHHDDEAGILCARSESGATVIVSTRGQPPQGFSRDYADFRYAGATLIHLSTPETGPLIAPPGRIERQRLTTHPQLCAWTPTITFGNVVHSPQSIRQMKLEFSGDRLLVELEARFVPMFKPEPRSVFARLVSAMDWRLLNGRASRLAALRRKPAEGVKATFRMDIALNSSVVLAMTSHICSSAANVHYLNPESGNSVRDALTPNVSPPSEHAPVSLPGAVRYSGPPVQVRACEPARTWHHTLSSRVSEF